MKVSLSILNIDYLNIKADLEPIIDDLDYLHLDVMDGVFVPNISFGPALIKSIRPLSNILFDTHLMIDEPLKYIKDYVDCGSDLITFHLEAKSDILKTINEIRKYNKKVGISIKPNTPVKDLLPYLNLIDLVLIMSVEPGYGGQKFMANSLDKIAYLIDYRNKNNLNYLVSVDGGINYETAKLVNQVNVDFVISGTYVLDKNNPKQKLELLKNI